MGGVQEGVQSACTYHNIYCSIPNTSCLCLVIAGEQEATGRTGRGKSITATLGLVVHAAGKDTHLL